MMLETDSTLIESPKQCQSLKINILTFCFEKRLFRTFEVVSNIVPHISNLPGQDRSFTFSLIHLIDSSKGVPPGKIP